MRRSHPWLGTALLLALCLVSLPALAMDQPQGLTVVSLMPQGRVERLTQVVVSFSRPMRPLGDMSQEVESAPLKLDPRPPGSYRWLDPRTLAYILDEPLTGATVIRLTVPAGVRALDGSVLAGSVSARLSTPPVEPVSISPKAGSTLGPRPELRLVLSQPVELDSLARRLYFLARGRRIPARVQIQPLPSGEREEAFLARAYLVRPAKKLPAGGQVRLVMEAGVRPARGNLPSPRDHAWSFRGYRRLKLVKWEMRPNFQGKLDPTSPLILEFNNPVSPQALLKHLRITPRLKLDPQSMGTQPTRWFYLEPGFKPGHRYLVEIRAGLADAYGTKLARSRGLSLAIGDLAPLVSLAGGKGVLEAAPGRPALYPLKLRNLESLRLGLKFLAPEEIVPALVAESNRRWDQKPEPPREGEPGAVVRQLRFSAKPNRVFYHPLDLGRLLGRDPRGGMVLVDARATWPDDRGKPRLRIRRTFVQVTDLGLSLKVGESSGAVWVTGLSDGSPRAGVKLELRDRTNRVLWQGQSDGRGLARLPSLDKLAPRPDKKRSWRDPQVFLLARQGADLAVLPLSWSEDLFYSAVQDIPARRPGRGQDISAHAITQLPLYQPGQRVRFVVYLRRATPTGLRPVQGRPVHLEVQDPYGRVVSSLKGRPGPYGSIAGSLKLTPGARLGTYSFILKQKGRDDIEAGWFRVASFRPPDFRVRLEAPKAQLGAQTQDRLGLQAEYLFGAPVAGGKAQVEVEQRGRFFAPPLLDGYAVGDIAPPGQEPDLNRHLATLKAELDSQGRGQLKLPGAQPLPGFPVWVGLGATVSDAGDRAVSAWGGYLVHPAGIYLGLKTPTLAQAGEPVPVEIKGATPENQPVQGVPVEVKAFREVWETVRERGPGGFYHYLSRVRRHLVWQGQARLGPQGTKVDFTPPQAGTYLVVAEAADGKGRRNRSATYLYAAGSGLAGWQRFDDNRLELVAQPSTLEPGQKTRLLIKNPFARATALISLERRGVRRIMVRPVEGPAPVVEIPVGAEDAPNLFVGVLLVRGRVGEPGPRGLDLGKPQVRLGYLMLKVRDPQAGLLVKVSTDLKRAKPGQKIKTLVRVSRKSGDPLAAEVTLLAVDERVLVAAGGRDSFDPRRTFDQPRPLSVLTADARTQVVGRRFYAQKGAMDAGGGGAGQMLRRKFHPAVFWLAQARTDDQGRLEASFNLPHSLTAYRIVAVAADQGGDFGLGRAVVKVSQPLQMLSALPRFTVAGDRFQARVLVQNLGQEAGQVTVRIQTQGLKLLGPELQKLSLAPGQSKPAAFAVEALRPGPAVLTLEAGMGPHRDAVRLELDVLPAAPLVTAAAAGVLEPGSEPVVVPLRLPAGAQPGRGRLSLTLAPSLAGALGPASRMLLDYPWNCLEQRLSRAAAAALRLERLQGLEDAQHLRKLVEGVLAQVQDFQTNSGGFSFWPGVGRPNPFLTAYVLTAARQLERAGLGRLPARVESQARRYLLHYLRRSPAPKAGNLAGRVTEAFILRTLAARGAKLGPELESALSRLQGLSPFGLACLLETAQRLHLPKVVQELRRGLEASAQVTPTGLAFSTVEPGGLKAVMGSRLRGNAMALWVLSRFMPRYPRLHALARWVALELGQSSQLSTQEAVFGLWGLDAYLGSAGKAGPVQVEVDLDGRRLLEHRFKKQSDPPLVLEVMRDLLEAGQTQELRLKAAGAGRPLWTSRLSYAPAQAGKEPVNAGMGVSRFYRVVDHPGQESPRLGQEVECVLTLVVPDDRRYVLLHDPFPAGLEPVDAARGGSAPWPWRWRELRKSGLLLYAPVLEPGVYTYRYRLRAVAPGDFVLRSARAEEMYAPEVFGASPSRRMRVQ